MIDIIIPTYKNKIGLIRTLSSINTDLLEYFTINIIDDCSGEDYQDVIDCFPFINFVFNLTNVGPGICRQHVLSKTSEPYIMFIDTGDYFISSEIQNEILSTIKNNPEIDIFSWQFLIDNKPSLHRHNHLHGRVYKRKFLFDHNISFSKEGSYANEDIGFNRACRVILANEDKSLYEIDKPILVYDFDSQSITNINDGAFRYKQQNIGLALNSIHVYNIAISNKVNDKIIIDEINEIMCSLYYGFLRTLVERPEYKKNAWHGAKIYYDNVFKNYLNNPESFQTKYSYYLKKIYQKKRSWGKNVPVNISKFLKDLEKYNEVPSWYN